MTMTGPKVKQVIRRVNELPNTGSYTTNLLCIRCCSFVGSPLSVFPYIFFCSKINTHKATIDLRYSFLLYLRMWINLPIVSCTSITFRMNCVFITEGEDGMLISGFNLEFAYHGFSLGHFYGK